MKDFFSPIPHPSSVLIRDASFMITGRGVLRSKSVLISDRKIAEIGDYDNIIRKNNPAEFVIDASNCIVIPGLVNSHSHVAMALLRGYAEDLPLLSWLREKIWPAEARLRPEDVYLGAALGLVESLASGTTAITSVYFYDGSGSEAEAAYDLGMRGTFAHGIFDWTKEDGLTKTEEFVQRWHGRDEGRIRIATSAHAPYSCSPDLLKEIEALRVELNEKFGIRYRIMNTIHVAEARTEASEIETTYGMDARSGVASYLASLGVLNRDTVAAHSIHLTQDDYTAFRSSGASIASCPVSNLKVGMGVADLPKAIDTGITVALGTDGPASNNSLDMFETMKMASILAKGLHGDTTVMNSRQSFEAATSAAAHSLGQGNEIGAISPGMRADIVVMDLRKAHSTPIYDPYNHLVYAAKASDTRDVMVDGRVLMKDKAPLFVNLQRLKERVSKRLQASGLLLA